MIGKAVRMVSGVRVAVEVRDSGARSFQKKRNANITGHLERSSGSGISRDQVGWQAPEGRLHFRFSGSE